MTRTETWNGLREFVIGANYFELLSTPAAVDVKLYCKAPGGERVIADEHSVSAGWFHLRAVGGALLEPITRIEITNPSSQAVTFLYSDGTSGNRSVPADLTDRAARLLGIVYGNLGQVDQKLQNSRNQLTALAYGSLDQLGQVAIGGANALQITDRGIAYGASYAANSTLTANTSTTVFAAASNTNGAILWTATAATANASGIAGLAIAAHTSAPNGVTTGDVLASNETFQVVSTTFWSAAKLTRPVFIASGKGVYITTTVNESAGVRSAIYTLL